MHVTGCHLSVTCVKVGDLGAQGAMAATPKPPWGTSPDPASSPPKTRIERGRNYVQTLQRRPSVGFVQVSVMSGHEIQTPQLSVGIRIGGGIVLLGMLGALASSVSQPPPTIAHLMFLTLSSTCILAGMQLCAASYLAGRNAMLNRDLAEHVGVKVGQLTTQVGACNDVLQQLSAAPTVRLHEVNQALERISRDGIQEIAEHIDKAVERAVQELAGADVAASQREAVDGLVNMDDMRLLKRIDEKVRRANGQDT
jgi:hypothetical protein